MSQSDGERRKFVFVFTGPTEGGLGKPRQALMDSLGGYGCKILGWKLEASHDVSVNAKIQVVDEPSP